MKLTVVGCAGSYPNASSAASSYLIEYDGFAMVMDFGSGALGPMHDYIDPLRIDAVLLSHLHADHFLDMCSFYVVRRYHPSGMPPIIPVYGPDDVAERLASAYGMDPDPGMSDCFDARGYPTGEFQVGPFTVVATKVTHPVECYALRVTAAGRTLVFSGDTAPCEALVEAARGADVALFEASFREQDDNPDGLHLTARQAGLLAAEAGVGRLILTHLVAWHDNSGALAEAEVFGGDVSLAEPGLVVRI
ncbi:MAG: MBL fold metallo-hydrolase [Actinobacteria bacterium]|nr:MBL fold metallo-hydrolase [Actinomycetota bacterium]